MFCHFGPFLPFDLPNNPKNQKFAKVEKKKKKKKKKNKKKKKKTRRDIIILHLCTTNDDHMIYGS